MNVAFLIAAIISGALIGFIAGYFFAKFKAMHSSDLAQQSPLFSNLSNQIAEMKGKFEAIEKSRDDLENHRERMNDEKEKRIKEWMEGTNKLFEELKDKNLKTDLEKEKRIQEWMDGTKRFFEEQKNATESFLEGQAENREKLEKQRDAQLEDMKNIINNFIRTVSGTKTRGMVGEDILAEVLQNSIQAGVVQKQLNTAAGEVEFAWKLDANKYIPIDAKLPDIFDLVKKYEASENVEEQKSYKKAIILKVKTQIDKVQKYQNLPNTVDNCILVVPPAVIEIAPEVVSLGKNSNVFVCTYKDVFPIAHILEEQYLRLKEEGDIGKYKQLLKGLFLILEKISKKTETIKDAITQLTNANDSIKEEISKGKIQQ